MKRFPAEWEPQDAVLFAWPDEHTDWASQLDAVQRTYLSIFDALLDHNDVVLLVQESSVVALRKTLKTQFRNRRFSIYLYCTHYNDTWTRDFGPIGIEYNQSPILLDFTFDGWGQKFDASLDDAVTSKLIGQNVFGASHQDIDLVLEGGGIESNGGSTLLTTSECLLNANRNQTIPSKTKKSVIENTLLKTLGVHTIYWLDHGYLAGDDTDSHIDTLARFASQDTILYVKSDDYNDEHFNALTQLEAQLKTFTREDGKPFNLIPLPLPEPVFSDNGERLPATYANFLISNSAVLVPIYHNPKDESALLQLRKAFPSHCVIGIDCRPLIEQHGSLHCISMQLLKNTVSFDKLDKI